MKNKLSLIKGSCSVELSCSDEKNMIREVSDYHIYEEPKENIEIGLHGYDFNVFTEYGGLR